jgi:ATP-dependent DNA helicase RecQ
MTSTKCRRKTILRHFEQEVNENCNNCDNCKRLNNKNIQKRNFTEEALMIIYTVMETGNNYGANMIIDVLRGMKNKKIPVRFFNLRYYGKGHHCNAKWWKSLIHMMIDNDLLEEISSENHFGTSIKVTSEGDDWEQLASNMDKELVPDLLWNVSREMEQYC